MNIFLIILINIAYSGIPISDPFADTIDGKQLPYNLIDTDPSCFHNGLCNMFPPGGELSAFPNSEEKFQHILGNLHRMFANQSLGTPLGKWRYGGNEGGGLTQFCKKGCSYCGTTHWFRRPLMWYSDANQMARFKQWDEHYCDQSWYNEPGMTAHSTCKWGNTTVPARLGFENGVLTKTYNGQQYKTGTNRCSYFGVTANPSSSPTNPTPFSDNCEFSARAGKFCWDRKDRCWFETEGICGGSTCVTDPHCEPIFANKYDYVGKGFVAYMNGVGAVYSRFTKEIYYPLPIGTHYDQRYRIVPSDRETVTGKYFVLLLEYFDFNKTQTPTHCYALYDGTYTDMGVYVSNHPYDGGGWVEGIYDSNDYSVIFKSNFLPPTTCQPYSFLCKTSLGNFFRLPEEDKYYFGTEWIDWVWSDYEGDFGYNCKENHYFDHPTEGWTVNGGPTLTKSDIWYYQDTENYGSCLGCNYIANLQCWEECILNDFEKSSCVCSGSHSPTTGTPTKQPTAPTTKAPTTKSPTAIPTEPTDSPSRSPLAEGETHPPSIPPTLSPISTPSPSSKPHITNVTVVYNPYANDGGGDTVIMVVLVLLGVLLCIFLFGFIYYRHQTGKSIIPGTNARLPRLPKMPSTRASENQSQISKQITEDQMRMQIHAVSDNDNGTNTYAQDGEVMGGPPPPPLDAIKTSNQGMTYVNNEYNDENITTPLSKSNKGNQSIVAGDDDDDEIDI